MSKRYSRTIYTLSALLLFVLLGGPQLAQAWTMPQQEQQGKVLMAESLPDAPSATMQQEQQQQQATTPAQQQTDQQQAQQPADAQTQNGQQPANAKNKKNQAPLGAAAAEKGVTAGGAASRPAGAALAPANQNQKRSLLIKLGLVAAGAAAIGTVYALSHATGSTPPGSGR
ncbi:MAG: hypothetical protein ACRD3E_13450 [Terriglobales bacterium]